MALPGVAPTYEYIGGKAADGLVIGVNSSVLLGFYGITTPVAQPALSAYAAVATTAPSSTITVFALTSAQQASLITLANGLRAALVTLNLAST